MKTILETLESGTQWLEKKGIADARHNMQLLLCSLLKCSKIHLYTRFDEVLTEQELAPLRDMLKRRGEREPLQHILGTVEFYMREFHSDARALIPRPETEELCEIILKKICPTPPSHLLDLGTGSGVIGLTLALEYGAQTTATLSDISQDSLQLAEYNRQQLHVENAHCTHSNLFESFPSQTFDLIVANLPYIPETERVHLEPELNYDPDLALFSGKDGLDIIRKFIQNSPSHLNQGASIALEIGIHQHTQVEHLLAERGFTDIHTYPDLSGIHRFPTARWQQH